MDYAYLLIGGNIGQKEDHLRNAAELIEGRCGKIIDRSSFYITAAWGNTSQDDFLNQALVVETTLNPGDLMKSILEIEQEMGRDRQEKFGPRTIDIDIIFYNHLVVKQPGITLPHPEMQNRRFVLEPLNEIIPAYIHPVFYKTVRELLMDCTDSLSVKKIAPPL